MRSRPEPLSKFEWFDRRVRKSSDSLMAALGTQIEADQSKGELRFLKGAAIYLEAEPVIQAIDRCASNQCLETISEVIDAFKDTPRAPTVRVKRLFDSDEVEKAGKAAEILRSQRKDDVTHLDQVAEQLIVLLSGENFNEIRKVWERCKVIGETAQTDDENLFLFDAMSELYFDCIVDFLMAPDWMINKLDSQLSKVKTDDNKKKSKKKHSDWVAKESTPAVDEALISVFLEEADEIIDELSTIMSSPPAAEGFNTLLRHLHTLKGAARMVSLVDFGAYLHEVEQKIEPIKEDLTFLTKENWSGISELWHDISDALSIIKQKIYDVDLKGARERCDAFTIISPEASNEPVDVNTIINGEQRTSSTAEDAPLALLETIEDRDLVEVFLDEASELIPEIDNAIEALSNNNNDMGAVDEIKRHLHTLKGGARMVGQKKLGQFIHHTEDGYQNCMQDKVVPKGELDTLLNKHHILKDAVTLLHQKVNENLSKPVSNEQSTETSGSANAGLVPTVSSHSDKRRQSLKISMKDINHFSRLISTATVARTQVEADILDIENLINLQNKETQAGLRETIKLKGELNLEALSSEQKRALKLIEEKQSTLLMNNEKIRELLYTAQGRLFEARNAVVDLERGLTSAQMVSFESLIPRLKKMVEQLCGELGKKINFSMNLRGDEIDRQTLEQLIPVFEHMLRNAIDHGVDTPDNRVKNGKDPTGNIGLSVKRSGTDTLISFSDDGRGINVDGIRKKAIEKGMLGDNAELSNQELLRFILQPGFSTTTAVTKISGRGVGMDVVNSEIEKMGGSLVIETQKGKGTSFTIVLPFTQSLNEVLLLTIKNQWYALPTHSIEGIVRIPYKSVLAHLHDLKNLKCGDVSYRVRYLGNLLHEAAEPSSLFEKKAMPLILLKVADTALALLVDHVIGARKVVTKSPGPQISKLKNYSGACMLPNGRVVMILDAMVLEHAVLFDQRQAVEIQQNFSCKCLVVDDSSTVRQMTKALLEKNNFGVSMAKDGVEAMQMMSKERPDLVVLDIDMPRMNGYEVASAMRADKGLKDVPIIIVSSRNSEVHMNKAKSLRVAATLVKPYEENELIGLVNEHVLGGNNA